MGHDKVTIQEAAKRLGVKDGAIRKRIERGTIDNDKDPDSGRVYVYVDVPPVHDDSTGYDKGGTGYDAGNDTTYPAGYDMLLQNQQDQIEFLRRESERKDAIIMQMAQANAALAARVPELEAAPGQREAPETPSQEADNGEVRPEQQAVQRRSWWRRMFGV
jgi:hypothetical protein